MPLTPYDQACRYLARLDPAGLFAWLLGLPKTAFTFESWLDTRRIAFPGDPDRTCDTVAFLRDQARHGIPWARVLEFQSEPDALMFGRLLSYLGALWAEVKPSPEQGDRFEVAALVVNLTGVGRSGRDCDWPEAHLRTLIQLPDRNLCQRDASAILDRIAAGEVTRAVLAWIPLMQGGGDDGIIQRWKNLASAEPDPMCRGDHGGLALIFAEAAGCAPAWKKALEGWNVMQSQQVQEWQSQAAARERQDAILELLEARFGGAPTDLAERVRNVADRDLLKRWFQRAARADTLDDFRRDAGL